MKTLKQILLTVLSLAIGMTMAAGVAMLTDNANAVVCVFFFAPIVMALVFGIFDLPTREAMRGRKYDSIKHKIGLNKAA